MLLWIWKNYHVSIHCYNFTNIYILQSKSWISSCYLMWTKLAHHVNKDFSSWMSRSLLFLSCFLFSYLYNGLCLMTLIWIKENPDSCPCFDSSIHISHFIFPFVFLPTFQGEYLSFCRNGAVIILLWFANLHFLMMPTAVIRYVICNKHEQVKIFFFAKGDLLQWFR